MTSLSCSSFIWKLCTTLKGRSCYNTDENYGCSFHGLGPLSCCDSELTSETNQWDRNRVANDDDEI